MEIENPHINNLFSLDLEKISSLLCFNAVMHYNLADSSDFGVPVDQPYPIKKIDFFSAIMLWSMFCKEKQK